MRKSIRNLFTKAAASKKFAPARLSVEGLETRAVLTTANLTNGVLNINGSFLANDVIEVRAANANSVTVLSKGVVVADFPFAAPAIKAINVDGGFGNDQLTVTSLPALLNGGQLTVRSTESVFISKTAGAGKFTTADVRSPIAIADPVGLLNVANDAAAGSQFVTLTATSITGMTPKPITYVMDSGPRLILQTGSANDTINVTSTPKAKAGEVQLITNGGSDTVNVASTDVTVRITAGVGDDKLNVTPVGRSLAPINGFLEFKGDAGTDFVSVNDQNEVGLGPVGTGLYVATVADDFVRRESFSTQSTLVNPDIATVGFAGVESVVFSASERTLDAASRVVVTETFAPTLVNAGARDVVVGNGKLNGIVGPLTVNRATAGGKLTLNDSLQPNASKYNLSANSVTKPGIVFGQLETLETARIRATDFVLAPLQVSVTFNDNVQNVRVLAGSKDDAINVSAVRNNFTRYDIHGGGGRDTLTAPNRDNDIAVNGANAGILDGTVDFSSIESLAGNAKDDHVFFFQNGSLDGTVNGGGGTFDTLDYVFLSTPVAVNLQTGLASRVGTGTGRVAEIENVYGGSASDSIVGNSKNNVLMGNAGNDILTGGGGADLLIGGDGADNLSNANGVAIYIGGKTTGSLGFFPEGTRKAVMAEWTRTDLPGTAEQQFVAKRNHLRNGGGLNGNAVLNGNTLAADGLEDVLDPNGSAAAFDLFVIDVRDTFKSAANTPSAVETANRIVV